MSSEGQNPYNIAGKRVQGGVPADLQIIRFNFATNQWEFVAAPAGEANLGANVGAGTGLLFRNKTGVTLNFKSLIAGTGITINNNADDIEIIASGGAAVSEVEFLQGKDAAGKMRNVFGESTAVGDIITVTPPVATTTVVFKAGGNWDVDTGGQWTASIIIDGVTIETLRYVLQGVATDGILKWITKGKQLIGDGAKNIRIRQTESINTDNLRVNMELYDL